MPTRVVPTSSVLVLAAALLTFGHGMTAPRAETPPSPGADRLLVEPSAPTGLPGSIPGTLEALPLDRMLDLSLSMGASPDLESSADTSPAFTLAARLTTPVSRQFGLPRIGGPPLFPDLAWSGPRALGPDEAYNILVVGDSLATGVHAGLNARLQGHERVNLIRKTKRSTGLVNSGFYDWPENIEAMIERYDIDAAVVVIGANDRMNMVHDGDVYKFMTSDWKDEYGRRVDRISRSLTDAGAAVYWVGMPITKDEQFTRKMKGLNDIFEARADANRVRFVSTWDVTTDEDGDVRTHYTRGDTRRRLRLHDGVHFTWNGYRLLAKPVARSLTADFGLRDHE